MRTVAQDAAAIVGDMRTLLGWMLTDMDNGALEFESENAFVGIVRMALDDVNESELRAMYRHRVPGDDKGEGDR